MLRLYSQVYQFAQLYLHNVKQDQQVPIFYHNLQLLSSMVDHLGKESEFDIRKFMFLCENLIMEDQLTRKITVCTKIEQWPRKIYSKA